MTKAMDDLHNDQSMPALRQAVGEWTEAIREERLAEPEAGTSRRRFLIGAGGLVAARRGCWPPAGARLEQLDDHDDDIGDPDLGTTSGSSLSKADAGSLAVDASIENLAVFAYTAGIAAATAGKLGKVPPAVPTFAETALSHHKAHAAAFNAVLSAAGLKMVTAPDPVLTPVVKSAFAKVKTIPDLAELAVLLENTAAQSYQDDAASFANKHATTTSASIMPVEMTHAAILYYVLGKYPGVQSSNGSPLSFNPLTLSRPNSDIATA